jgi:hypothetical protein
MPWWQGSTYRGPENKAPIEISRLTKLEPDRPQHDHPAACVIAQQYSFATFVSLCFHSRNENFGHFNFPYVVNICVKISFKLRKAGNFCNHNQLTNREVWWWTVVILNAGYVFKPRKEMR